MNKLDLGAVSAYALAKEKGYQGTEEEFATLMMQSGDNALRAEAAANRAEEILGSIPSEYTELSNQVGENTENVAALAKDIVYQNEQKIDDITTTLTILVNKYIDKNTGEVVDTTNSATVCVNKMHVEAGQIFYLTGKYGWDAALWAEYDADGEFLRALGAASQTDVTDQEYVVSADAAFASFSSFNGLRIKKLILPTVKDHIAHIENALVEFTGVNLIDEALYESGYIGTDGTITPSPSSATYKSSDYIAVNAGEKYTFSGWDIGSKIRRTFSPFFYTEYDEQKNFLRQTNYGVGSTVTIANDASFVRFSYEPTKWSEIQLEKGEYNSAYRPYRHYVGVNESNVISRIAKKMWAVVGDSLTEKNLTANTNYYDYVADDLGLIVLNHGVSGSGYKKKDDTDKAFYQRILNIGTAFDVLTIFGSFNDLSAGELGTENDTEPTTVGGAINKTLDNYYSTAPFKRIGLITPTPWKISLASKYEQDAYVDLLIKIARKRSIPILDLYHNSGLNPNDTAHLEHFYNENGVQDAGCHPNSEGHKLFYPMVREFMKMLI